MDSSKFYGSLRKKFDRPRRGSLPTGSISCTDLSVLSDPDFGDGTLNNNQSEEKTTEPLSGYKRLSKLWSTSRPECGVVLVKMIQITSWGREANASVELLYIKVYQDLACDVF